MSFPSFSAGEVLTAADMNAVGLWLVKTVTIGTGVTSVPVTSCFSSTYENYRVIVGMDNCNTSTTLRLQLDGITSTSYFSNGYRIQWGTSFTNVVSAAETSWNIGDTFSGFPCTAFIDIADPQVSTNRTVAQSANPAPGFATNYLHQVTVNTATTGFTISVASGTMTGGTIRVYGYRN